MEGSLVSFVWNGDQQVYRIEKLNKWKWCEIKWVGVRDQETGLNWEYDTLQRYGYRWTSCPINIKKAKYDIKTGKVWVPLGSDRLKKFEADVKEGSIVKPEGGEHELLLTPVLA